MFIKRCAHCEKTNSETGEEWLLSPHKSVFLCGKCDRQAAKVLREWIYSKKHLKGT